MIFLYLDDDFLYLDLQPMLLQRNQWWSKTGNAMEAPKWPMKKSMEAQKWLDLYTCNICFVENRRSIIDVSTCEISYSTNASSFTNEWHSWMIGKRDCEWTGMNRMNQNWQLYVCNIERRLDQCIELWYGGKAWVQRLTFTVLGNYYTTHPGGRDFDLIYGEEK
jgi:hypothetical protein